LRRQVEQVEVAVVQRGHRIKGVRSGKRTGVQAKNADRKRRGGSAAKSAARRCPECANKTKKAARAAFDPLHAE
jgi:hypothetical protein